MISVGSEVFIQACPHGTPGVVVRFERNRIVVWWADLDYLSRHAMETVLVMMEHAERTNSEFRPMIEEEIRTREVEAELP